MPYEPGEASRKDRRAGEPRILQERPFYGAWFFLGYANIYVHAAEKAFVRSSCSSLAVLVCYVVIDGLRKSLTTRASTFIYFHLFLSGRDEDVVVLLPSR